MEEGEGIVTSIITAPSITLSNVSHAAASDISLGFVDPSEKSQKTPWNVSAVAVKDTELDGEPHQPAAELTDSRQDRQRPYTVERHLPLSRLQIPVQLLHVQHPPLQHHPHRNQVLSDYIRWY